MGEGLKALTVTWVATASGVDVASLRLIEPNSMGLRGDRGGKKGRRGRDEVKTFASGVRDVKGVT